MNADNTDRDVEQVTKTRALEAVNEAVRRCMLAGIDVGVSRLWNSRGEWCLLFGAGVVWDEGQGFSWCCPGEDE